MWHICRYKKLPISFWDIVIAKAAREIRNFSTFLTDRNVISDAVCIFQRSSACLESVKNVHGHKRVLSMSIKAGERHSRLNRAGQFSRLFRQIFSPVVGEKGILISFSRVSWHSWNIAGSAAPRACKIKAVLIYEPLSRGFHQFNITRKRSVFSIAREAARRKQNVRALYPFILNHSE